MIMDTFQKYRMHFAALIFFIPFFILDMNWNMYNNTALCISKIYFSYDVLHRVSTYCCRGYKVSDLFSTVLYFAS